MNDELATDTADPAKVFRAMFPTPVPRMDWRLFCSFNDLIDRGVIVDPPEATL